MRAAAGPGQAGGRPALGLVNLTCFTCRSPLAYMLALSVGVYSLPAHKEFRFLLPALQLAMPFCGLGAAWLLERPAALAEQANSAKGKGQNRGGVRRLALAALILAQLPMGAYFSTVQHRHVPVSPGFVDAQRIHCGISRVSPRRTHLLHPPPAGAWWR